MSWTSYGATKFKSKKLKLGYRVVTAQTEETYCGPKLWSTKVLGIIDTTWGLTQKGAIRRAQRRFSRASQPRSTKDILALVIPICVAVIAASATVLAAIIKLN